MLIILNGPLIPWKSHGGSGRKSFNPLYKEREQVQWQIKSQNPLGIEMIKGPVRVDFTYYFQIPKSFSKVKRLKAIFGNIVPTVRPDGSNLNKFYEDCIKDFVIEDDSFIVASSFEKRYADKSSVVIKISRIEL